MNEQDLKELLIRDDISDVKTVLDHGYVGFVESWGSDKRIIEAARMSTKKGFLGWGGTRMKCSRCGAEREKSVRDDFSSCPKNDQYPFAHQMTPVLGDEKLLRYLYEHKHSTPFEMAGMTIEVQAPIFVFREWHRHRTQSYNEMSARYTPLPNVNYLPEASRCLLVNGKNKQAGKVAGAAELTHESVLEWLDRLEYCYLVAEQTYQDGLQRGVPKELARLAVPVGRYSRMRASANLRNWLAFLTLRMNPDAQWEIRQFATAVGSYIQKQFPRTWELFVEGRGA